MSLREYAKVNLWSCVSGDESCYQKDSCEMHFHSSCDRMVIDGDRYKSNFAFKDPICDWIVLMQLQSLTVHAVEMKTGHKIDLTHAQTQICNGAKVADDIVTACESNNCIAINNCIAMRFYPILLAHADNIRAIAYRMLRRREGKIPFRGKKYSIIVERCGVSLESIMAKYP